MKISNSCIVFLVCAGLWNCERKQPPKVSANESSDQIGDLQTISWTAVVFPQVKLNNDSLSDVLEFMKRRCETIRFDGGRIQVPQWHIDAGIDLDAKINITTSNVTLIELCEMIANDIGYHVKFDPELNLISFNHKFPGK